MYTHSIELEYFNNFIQNAKNMEISCLSTREWLKNSGKFIQIYFHSVKDRNKLMIIAITLENQNHYAVKRSRIL